MRNSTLKALAIHTADDIWNPGPDYVTGWGVFNVASAVQQVELDAQDGRGSHIKELELEVGATNSWRVWLDAADFKATAAWSDLAGTPDGIDDSTTPMLVNNIDLWVENDDGTETYYPWILDPDLENESATARSAWATTGYDDRNNVEQVEITNPTAGYYRIFVTHSGGLPSGTLPDTQWVSVLTSGDTPIAPIIQRVEVNAASDVALLTFECDPGAYLSLESCTNLVEGSWVATDLLKTKLEMNALTNSVSGNVRFWRLRRETGE